MNITKMGIFIIFIFKLEANFPGLQPKYAYFFDFIYSFGLICQKNTPILAISREQIKSKKYPISVVSLLARPTCKSPLLKGLKNFEFLWKNVTSSILLMDYFSIKNFL